MPITLITGPANAGKAQVVMDAVRAHLARGEEPLLIVPTRADVDHYRRELAGGGRHRRTRRALRRPDRRGGGARRRSRRAAARRPRSRSACSRIARARAARREPGARAGARRLLRRGPGASYRCGEARRPGHPAWAGGGPASDLPRPGPVRSFASYQRRLSELRTLRSRAARPRGPRRASPQPGPVGRHARAVLRL